MARVQFSALINEVIGKLAGSVFQDSYGGFQIRTRVSPRNARSNFQQLRRGEFGYITQLWRELSTMERNTWVSASPSGQSGFHFFVQCNVNLTLINQPLISTYLAASIPGDFPMNIISLGAGIFTVVATGSPTTVPADTTILLFSTAEKGPGKIFTSPSQYTPITQFNAAADLSAPISIASDWIARFGQFTSGKRICIKTVAISTVNGLRSAPAFSCSDELAPTFNRIIDFDSTLVTDLDSTFIISPD